MNILHLVITQKQIFILSAPREKVEIATLYDNSGEQDKECMPKVEMKRKIHFLFVLFQKKRN